VVFVHGFPDSSLMFRDYFSEDEQEEPWLKQRSIYAFSFPNRHDNSEIPPISKLFRGVIAKEFDQHMNKLSIESPTTKLIFVAHDWGATHVWRWARHQQDPPIEKFVALSVGSSFRFDILEHGLNAFVWMYGLWFALAWYIPFLRTLVGKSIVKFGGYRSSTASDLWKDAYHYWDRLILPLTILPQALGLINYQREYLDFTFPVLYIRTPDDRIASTAAFERLLRARPDCRIVPLEQTCHWFPEQHSDTVLPYVRGFLGESDANLAASDAAAK
jgi:pimeloyl-ACP methyl ester carboxylesterase